MFCGVALITERSDGDWAFSPDFLIHDCYAGRGVPSLGSRFYDVGRPVTKLPTSFPLWEVKWGSSATM